MQTVLRLESKWYDDGLHLAKWSESSKKVLSSAFFELREILLRKVSPYCMHLKGRGGIKGSVRLLHRKLIEFPFAARFDVKSFYGSINHKILLRLINNMDIKPTGGTPVVHPKSELSEIIRDYVIIPDTENKGKGIVAGGALSTLLGALYLSPLDSAMNALYKKGSIFYLRYQDDCVILAKSRWKLKTALKLLYTTLDKLQLKIHREEKYFVGKSSKGISFLGYYFIPGRKPKPSCECLGRFVKRARQLLEQFPSTENRGNVTPRSYDQSKKDRLLDYVMKFYTYLGAGLCDAASHRRARKIILFIEFKLGFDLSAKITLC